MADETANRLLQGRKPRFGMFEPCAQVGNFAACSCRRAGLRQQSARRRLVATGGDLRRCKPVERCLHLLPQHLLALMQAQQRIDAVVEPRLLAQQTAQFGAL